MFGRTRLHQSTGSPLIQGRSTIARPLWRTVAGSSLGVVAFGVVAGLLIPDSVPEPLGLWRLAAAVPWAVALAVAVAIAGAWLGATIARAYGTPRRWPASFAFGMAGAYVMLLGLWAASLI